MLKHFITFLRFACQFFGFCLSNIILQLMRKYKLFEIARTLVEAPEELGGHTYPEEHLKLNY